MDRRAVIVGSWQGADVDHPSPQKIKSLTDRWKAVFAADIYGFRSLTDPTAMPEPMLNPKPSEIHAHIESAEGVTADSELFFYFVGHSTTVTDHDIRFGLSKEKNRILRMPFHSLLEVIKQNTDIKKTVFVLDTCHAGCVSGLNHIMSPTSFAMFATGTSFAFDAAFSDSLLKSLEREVRGVDQRIDRLAGGITYQKIFQEARGRLINDAPKKQEPFCSGAYGTALLLPVPLVIPDDYNPNATRRSIYGRVHRLMAIVDADRPNWDQLRRLVGSDSLFLLREDDKGDSRYLSSERLEDYLAFLHKVGWLAQPEGSYILTDSGTAVLSSTTFNRDLLKAIEDKILPDGVSLEYLDGLVKGLLTDLIPTTPSRIRERAAMQGKNIILDAATRVAFQILPSTGRFLKGAADAIFPAESYGSSPHVAR